MIRLPATLWEEPADIRWGLEVLVDLSGLLPVEDADAPTVRLELHDGDAPALAGDASPQVWSWEDGVVRVARRSLREFARIASAADEQRSDARDRHGRVPSAENTLVRSGSADRPVLNHMARDLRQSFVRALGGRLLLRVAPWPDGHSWAAAVTHDVDVVGGWPLAAAARSWELLSRRRFDLASRAFAAAVRRRGGSPPHAAARHILDVERRHGVRATWFFLCERPTIGRVLARDVTYSAGSPAARLLMDAISGADHEIGLHGSFETAADAGRFAAQRHELARLSGQDISGVRQHFLRLRPGRTHVHMQSAGFQYDASMGFAERTGFRLGAADVLPAWDALADRAIGLDLVPLAWMDRSASKYRKVESPAEWVAEGMATVRAAREAGGLWVGLWHPYLTDALGFPGAPLGFESLIRQLHEAEPWFAPVRDIVAWRQWRRSVRVLRARPGEDPVLGGPGDPRTIRVENECGVAWKTLTRPLAAHG